MILLTGAAYELAGTTPLTQIEVAGVLSASLGLSVRAVAEPVEAWDARARAVGMGDYLRETMAATTLAQFAAGAVFVGGGI